MLNKRTKRGRPAGSSNLSTLKSMLENLASIVERTNERIDQWEERRFFNNLVENTSDIHKSTENLNLAQDIRTKHESVVRLPKHQLPSFSGNSVEWLQFWQHFSHIIHNVDHINNIDKLIYLKSCLKGEALNLIKHLPLITSSYSIAVGILSQEYSDGCQVVKTLYRSLLKVKSCDQTLRDLRRFLDEISQILLQLNLSTNVDINNILVIIEKKLPIWIAEKLIILESENKINNIHDILKCLRSNVKVKEFSAEATDSFAYPVRSNQFNSRSLVRPSNIQNAQLSRPAPNNRPAVTFTTSSLVKRCMFCEGTHYSKNCSNYKTPSDREARLLILNRCIKCTKGDHLASSCNTNLKCINCGQPHHLYLCRTRSNPPVLPQSLNSQPTLVASTSSSIPNSVLSVIRAESSFSPVLLKCINCIVSNPNNPNITNNALILMDDGSTTSYITKSLISKLKLTPTDSETLNYVVFNEDKVKECKTDLVPFKIQTKFGSYLDIVARSVNQISKSIPHAKLKNTEFDQVENKFEFEYGAPDILIGSDVYYQLEITPLRILPSGFTLVNSILGHMIAGPGRIQDLKDYTYSTNFSFVLNVVSITKKIENFLSSEDIGIVDQEVEPFSLDAFKEQIIFKNGRYEVPLPWKIFPPGIPTNFGLCLGRLSSTLKFLRSKPKLLEQYHQNIVEQLNSNIIERVNEENECRTGHYIPHQPVINYDKNKLRIVFDASAKVSKANFSLNQCLYPGPLVLQNLSGILLRFRLHAIVVLADIEKAFLQVSLSAKDRNYVKFLWAKNPFDPNNHEVDTYRFTRIAFGLSPSPFLLGITLTQHFENSNLAIAKELITNLYVDNIMLSSTDKVTANNLSLSLKNEFKTIGMNVREFVSNEASALSFLDPCDIIRTSPHKVLGILWDWENDNIMFQIKKFNNNLIVTKEAILSYIASIFDPNGLISPAILPYKLFFQNLWLKNLKWTEPLTQELVEEWTHICSIPPNYTLSLARRTSHLPFDSNIKYELHGFCDASQKAFCCVIYLKTIFSNNTSEVSLIFSKSRVCPKRLKNSLSIHRSELLGVLIGSKAIVFVYNELIRDSRLKSTLEKKLQLWTDSTTVLHWLNSPVKQDRFIENRLCEICAVPDLVCKYVNTLDNPADVACRGCSFEELQNHALWWKGPLWLQSSKFPIYPNIPTYKARYNSYRTTTVEITLNVIIDSSNQLVDFSRFSSWNKLINTICYVIRFLKKSSSKLNKNFGFNHISLSKDYLSLMEINYSKLVLIRFAQTIDPPKHDELVSLNLKKDLNNIYRCYGRIDNSHLRLNLKNPIWMPAKSRLTELYILYVHKILLHAGTRSTLTQVRFNYWITRGRRVVDQILRKGCFPCKKLSAPSYSIPEYPNLPAARVQPTPVFSHSGVDYFGPLISTDVGKIWVVLFTCMSSRAIHLEVARNLSTEGFISVFRRFISRRGKPATLTSDNGKQFVAACKILKNINKNFLSTHGIEWKFITEKAPWKGGFYERLIGLVKYHIRRSFNKERLSLEEIHTILCEIELVVNCRPLSFISDKFEDFLPLRPIDLLAPNINSNLLAPTTIDNAIVIAPNPSTTELLLKNYHYSQNILKKFWTFWSYDYLLSLRERSRKIKNTKKDLKPKVGDIVLIYEQNIPRSSWKLGIVTNNNLISDETRTVEIRTANNFITRRAVNHLFPLESSDE